MSAVASPRISVAEYLARSQESELRLEYYNGEVVSMVGSSAAHALVTMNLGRLLGNALHGGPCRVFSADLRVHVVETEAWIYPDLTVVCGPPRLLPTRPQTLANPTLVVEVLSKSTAAHDRGPKAAHYRRLGSLGAYVLVDIAQRRVECTWRGEDGVWRLAEAQGEEGLQLPVLDVFLPLADLWEGLDEVELAGASGEDASQPA